MKLVKKTLHKKKLQKTIDKYTKQETGKSTSGEQPRAPEEQQEEEYDIAPGAQMYPSPGYSIANSDPKSLHKPEEEELQPDPEPQPGPSGAQAPESEKKKKRKRLVVMPKEEGEDDIEYSVTDESSEEEIPEPPEKKKKKDN